MTHQQKAASSPSHWVTLVLVTMAGVTSVACALYVTWWALEGWLGGRAAVWVTLTAHGGAVAAALLRARRLERESSGND